MSLTNTSMLFKVLIFVTFISKLTNGNVINKAITIETLNILKSPYVHMENETAVFEKINKILTKGADKLQIISDFDRTLTKQQENNTKTWDSYDMFYKCKQLPESNMERINAARAEFLAIQFNTTVPIEQRRQISDELQKVFQKNLHNIPFDRKEFHEVVHKYGPSFRDKTDELFSKLKDLNVPVTLFSAGVTDIIEVQLNQKNLKYDNVNIVANQLKFNGTMLDGYQDSDKSVNAFNKQEGLFENINSEILKNRKNIILMGDLLADAAMVSSLDNEFTVLKIGFFYDQTEEVLKKYQETFDIVLDNDQTMNVILDIIKLL